MHDWRWVESACATIAVTKMPRPLVPRADVFEVDERLDAHGAALAAPDPRALERLARELRTRGLEAAAVCLLHAYLDASHERQVAEAVARVAPEIAVSVSADVMPDIGEYERASTTVANAYIGPIVRGYLDRLRGTCAVSASRSSRSS